MKSIVHLIFVATLLFSHWVHAAASADARLYCLSVQIQRGYDQNQIYSIDFTTLGFGVNGELAPLAPGGYSHGAWFNWNDHIFDESYAGILNLSIPSFTDGNGNGFDDFFEVARGVPNRTSTGVYDLDDGGGGNINATWSRAAGSADGTVTLTFQGLGTFFHSFRILEYTGALNYTPGATRVEGSIALEQTGSPGTVLGGELDFVKNSANRFNQLTNHAAIWTNAFEQSLSVLSRVFQRDVPSAPTNYYGYILFEDGDPNTGDPDFQLWLLSIDDLHDSDSDGIPNFSDDVALPQARRPALNVANTGTNLLLTISGDIGHLHQIQTHTNLATTNWVGALSVTLPNDPQRVFLPYPAASPRYWRAIAQ